MLSWLGLARADRDHATPGAREQRHLADLK